LNVVTAAAEFVRDTLATHGDLVQNALQSYLDTRAGRGELYGLTSDYPGRGGRRMRASLCIESAQAFGASQHDAINSAVSLELMHNAFLVHDDIEDGSEERRGRPTLHLLHGTPIAINTGDALAVLSLSPLIANQALLGPRLTLRILEEMERMARESVEGQAMELAWRRDNRMDLSEADYLRMILKKTCWYTTIYPCRLGALIGTRDGVELDRYVRFGFFLGAAFQIQDDVLNLIGEPLRYGKELSGDVWEGKRTLMLIRLCQLATPDERAYLASVLARERTERSGAEVRWISERMQAYGCIEHAREIAHGLAGAALYEFEQAYADVPESPHKRFLGGLANWVLERA
jgi:geranylgeranyl diphosphate synthase type II